MRVMQALVAALGAAVMLATVASAGVDATKQRVQVDMIHPFTFVLTPLQAGALRRDSGTQTCNAETEGGEVLRDGQVSYPAECRALVLTGKRGKLVLRYRYAWVEAGGEYNIATGTWSVVRGTRQYAGITGGGRSAEVASARRPLRLARFQGLVISP